MKKWPLLLSKSQSGHAEWGGGRDLSKVAKVSEFYLMESDLRRIAGTDGRLLSALFWLHVSHGRVKNL